MGSAEEPDDILQLMDRIGQGAVDPLRQPARIDEPAKSSAKSRESTHSAAPDDVCVQQERIYIGPAIKDLSPIL